MDVEKTANSNGKKDVFRIIKAITSVKSNQRSKEDLLRELSEALVSGLETEEKCGAIIRWSDKMAQSRFYDTAFKAVLSFPFQTSDGETGVAEYALALDCTVDEVSEISLQRDVLSALLSAKLDAWLNIRLQAELKERKKELRGIQQSVDILRQITDIEDSLRQICRQLPEAFQYPEHCSARIQYNHHIWLSENFSQSPQVLKQVFETGDGKKGLIEVFYDKTFPEPFLPEEKELLETLAGLISGSAIKQTFRRLLRENRERVKELRALNATRKIIAESLPVDDTLQRICQILPASWQFPRRTSVRIQFESRQYMSKPYIEGAWKMEESFTTIDNNKGTVEVFYTAHHSDEAKNPFLNEEYQLLANIAGMLSSYLNNYKGREIYRKSVFQQDSSSGRSAVFREALVKGKQPLQKFFHQKSADKYIYLEMMRYKVKDILFVATLYDAFMLETEDSFFERFMGEIYAYSLFSLPRITGVTTSEEAEEMLKAAHFDMVILMVGIDQETPIALSKKIKEIRPTLPVFLLLNPHANAQYFQKLLPSIPSIDKLFIWYGDAQIFFAIVKSTEDYANVSSDTQKGLVRVILLVEDSPQYYSKYLPMLYGIVFGQVQKLLPEAEKSELDKISKMRSRPKILHARNYEDAAWFLNAYKDYLLCVISDMEFDRKGKLDKRAGVKFIRYVKSHVHNVPIILQSAETAYEKIARELGVTFFNKNSETLLRDLRKFLNQYLGFGDFIFRDKKGNPIARASTFNELVEQLEKVPEESYYLHALENQYSIWLMARGEIKLAKTLNPVKVNDFKSIEESRQFFITSLRNYDDERKKGKILSFDERAMLDERNIVSLAGGSIGGKGRGLVFINALIHNFDFEIFANQINIRTPVTLIIGTDAFESFIRRNKLNEVAIHADISYRELREIFSRSRLPDSLLKKLRLLASKLSRPIAVRSSSLSEDSQTQPLAGVFDTFVIPDTDDKNLLASRLAQAIKLVYASLYSESAKRYFRAIHRKVEEERMAIVIQELVGNRYGNYYYPHISGVAQSYNYYPVGHMKPEEGFSMAAVGLGSYVVEGWQSYRFSPKYPDTSLYAARDLLKASQTRFFALDYSKTRFDFLKDGEHAALSSLDISEAEKHGNLKHCASVYNADNETLEPGIYVPGPRVIDFANILKYNYIPLAEVIDFLLETIKDSLGTPVELEYAVDIDKTLNGLPSFYLLQVKPLVGQQLNFDADFSDIDKEKMLLYTTSSLGNGSIDNLYDVIYVKNDAFDKLKTLELAEEIEEFNERMAQEGRNYILIGPGRWGTRDIFLGIPVNWSQISNAKVIVETSLENFPLDASLGSHFFHNITSMHIGYFSVSDTQPHDFIRWKWLEQQAAIYEGKYFRQIQLPNPLKVLMNGRKKMAAILIS
ncbi:MAG: hypothetical protein JJU28_10940 [Cyclobacteriaceae bacterium]|nr:hypothetical protein [Cyclobacteriaceae bacterium]